MDVSRVKAVESGLASERWSSKKDCERIAVLPGLVGGSMKASKAPVRKEKGSSRGSRELSKHRDSRGYEIAPKLLALLRAEGDAYLIFY